MTGKHGTLEKRFWAKVERRDRKDCWLWTASTARGGYGQLGDPERGNVKAHRLSWELHRGPVPDGLQVLHQCDQPRCVNPGHLFLGTNVDNHRDKMRKNRHAVGAAHGAAKLTEEDVIAIWRRAAAGERQKLLADEYGVSQPTVSDIVRRRTWRHVAWESLDRPPERGVEGEAAVVMAAGPARLA